MKNNILTKTAIASLVFSSTSIYAGSVGSEQCNDQSLRHYQACDSQITWYVGGELGMAKTDVSEKQLDTFYNKSGLDATSTDIDKSDLSGALFIGYQFNSYFALEAGYLNLGERSVDFTGQTSDLNAYYDNAEHIYPQSAKGFAISALVSVPLSERFKLTGKIGYFDWKGDYITYENQVQVGSDNESDRDLYYGLELDFRLTDSTQLYLGYQHFELTRDSVDTLGVGLRYYFSPPQLPRSQAVSLPIVATELDSDNDGIGDTSDKCANSDINYQVDLTGCVKMLAEQVSFSLSVLFENDSSTITPQYFDKIAELADFVTANNIKDIAIVGHTSGSGSASYNKALSQRRANAVAERLRVQHDIKNIIVKTIAQGEDYLKDKATTASADALNRRVEVLAQTRKYIPIKK